MLQVDQLEDPTAPVAEIVQRCPAQQLMTVYNIPAFAGADEFLQRVATARGKLQRGGTADVAAAARLVLHDWNDGRIPFYTLPPARDSQEGHVAAEVVPSWATDFDADEVRWELLQVYGLHSNNEHQQRILWRRWCLPRRGAALRPQH